MLDLPASHLHQMSPEQYCQQQQHWLPPENVGGALGALFAWLFNEDELGEQIVEGGDAHRQFAVGTWQSELCSVALRHHLPPNPLFR